jgi:hypothetical protein
MDAQKFVKGGKFLKKQELRREGPRRLVIAAVEEGEGLPDKRTGEKTAELQLVFDDDARFGLGTAENLRRLITLFGNDTDQWIGKTIEAYFAPDVPNPTGGEPGGVRFQLPGAQAEDFVSDLEPPAKPNGAEQSVKPRRVRAVPATEAAASEKPRF